MTKMPEPLYPANVAAQAKVKRSERFETTDGQTFSREEDAVARQVEIDQWHPLVAWTLKLDLSGECTCNFRQRLLEVIKAQAVPLRDALVRATNV